MLTIERLRALLKYDPRTGRWEWLVSRSRTKCGTVAGHIAKDGYRHIRVEGKKYKSSRLAWFYQKGKWPGVDVDHRDLDKANDRWRNLRLATGSQNRGNIRAQANNEIGLKGVSRVTKSKTKPFKAQIQIAGHKRNLGHFKTAGEAHAVYLRAARSAFGEFARG
jgi:hypothetical protein